MKTNGVIINCEDDYYNLKKKYRNSTFYASNYELYQSLKNKKIKYFYDINSLSSKQYFEVIIAAQNWYRDKLGYDLTTKMEISPVLAITRRLISCFANDMRVYISMQYTLSKHNKIYVPINSEKSFINVQKLFEKKITLISAKTLKKSTEMDKTFSSLPDRSKISEPRHNIFSFIFRFLQYPIRPALKSKILVIHDGNYKEQMIKRKDTLYMYNISPLKGFYLIKSKKYASESKDIFKKRYSLNFINNNNLKKILNSHNILWNDDLINLFTNSILSVYNESYQKMRVIYSAYRELFDYYEPKAIVFPGTTNAHYIIASQIAKKYKIKSIVSVDGYSITKDISVFPKGNDGTEFLYNKFIAYGKYTYKLYNETEKIPKTNLILAKPPAYDRLVKLKTDEKNIDLLIMAYYPNQHNPFTRWDKRYSFVYEILQKLDLTKYDKIYIKIKSGIGYKDEIENFKKVLGDYDLSKNVIVVSGKIEKYLPKAKKIIGQISTVCYEASILKIPYYAYEPIDNGLVKEYLEGNSFFNSQNVARNSTELIKNIIKGNSLHFVDSNFSSNGKNESEIELI